MGEVGRTMGVKVVRLYKEAFDLANPTIIDHIVEYVRANPGISIWGSLPCTVWCTWQRMSLHTLGADYARGLARRRAASMRLFNNFLRVAGEVKRLGGAVCFEWPKSSLGWGQPQVLRFINEFDLHEAICDGCAFGMADDKGHPILKSWRIATSSERLANELSQFRCKHEKGFTHSHLEGGNITPSSAFYPKAMCTAALSALFPEAATMAPAMPTVPIAAKPPHADAAGHC